MFSSTRRGLLRWVMVTGFRKAAAMMSPDLRERSLVEYSAIGHLQNGTGLSAALKPRLTPIFHPSGVIPDASPALPPVIPAPARSPQSESAQGPGCPHAYPGYACYLDLFREDHDIQREALRSWHCSPGLHPVTRIKLRRAC